MKTKTKKKLKKHLSKLGKVRRHAVKIKKHSVKLASKKVVRKKTGARLLRAFFIIVAAVSTGSLAFTVSTTKPTINLEVRTNIAKAVGQLNPAPAERAPDQVGKASWYALGLPAPDALTCASTTFPRGTYLLVTNLRNGKNVICLVNDYGPEAWTGRVIDLSRGSFTVIDSLGSGTAPVQIRVVPKPPTTIKLPFPDNFGAIVGYARCSDTLGFDFCNDNRQSTKKLK